MPYLDDSNRSQLFVVRVWEEQVADGRTEWRGKVQHVNSGDIGYFRDWQTLAGRINAVLASAATGQKVEKW